MRNLSVHWSEGMFLRPQHFQASDRHWHERASLAAELADPCCYGLASIVIDPGALAARQLAIRDCRARMQDGTLVSFELGEEASRIALDSADATNHDELVRVYLAVPRFDPLSPSVAPPGAPEQSRSVVVRRSIQDDVTGSDDQEIEFRRPSVRILLSTDDLSGFELLPIAQIRNIRNREAVPEIDTEYVPPLLTIDAWPPLGRDIVRGVYDLIGRKIEVLSEQAVNRQVGFSSSEPGDLDRLIMLGKLLESHAALRVWAFATGVHPRTAYAELCRVAGQLAVFEPARRIDDLPLYDHDDLGRIFRLVRDQIEAMLSRMVKFEFEQRYFVGFGSASLSVPLEQKWLQSNWQCYVGVQRGEMTEETCHRLLTGEGHLDWKLGSSEEVDRLFRMGLPGLELLPADTLPRALPTRTGWTYYRIGGDSPAWRSVQLTQSLGIRLRDSLILNANDLIGQRRVEVAYENRTGWLEFALFAIAK